MVIVQDQRPRDWAYMAAFKEKDLPSLKEMMKHIRETHDVDMIENFNQKCEQKLLGQSVTLDNGVEIESVTKTDDLVTNGGLQHCINLILGTSGTLFSHIIGSNSTAFFFPTVTDTALNTGSGGPYAFPLEWRESKGMKLFFATLVPQDTAGVSMARINEMAVYSGPAMTNVMLNHETFFSNPLTRSITQDLVVFANVFILSCIVEFCPVA